MLQICLFFSLEIAYFFPKHNLLYSRVVCYVRKSQQVPNPYTPCDPNPPFTNPDKPITNLRFVIGLSGFVPIKVLQRV